MVKREGSMGLILIVDMKRDLRASVGINLIVGPRSLARFGGIVWSEFGRDLGIAMSSIAGGVESWDGLQVVPAHRERVCATYCGV